MQLFNFAQRTQLNYTIGQAVKQAEDVIKAKRPGLPMCMNAIGRYASLTDKITLERMSNLVEQLVDDSFYHAY